MKSFWLLVAIAGLLSLASGAQTASGSASAAASVTPGQVDAGAKASQSAQAGSASANVTASAQNQVSSEHKAKQGSNSKSRAGANTAAGSAATAGAQTSPVLVSGTTLNAELTHSLDAKSAKPGDQVTAKVIEDVKSNGKVVVHKGSKLVGHVTEAQVRGKESSDSQLGLAFDKAVLKGGQEVSFNGAIQAIAPPVNAELSAAGDESSSISAPESAGGVAGSRNAGRGGLLGGATSTATGVVGSATSSVGATTSGAVNGTAGLTGGLTAQGRLTSGSQGAIALQGLTLNSATTGSAQGSVVSSNTRNVKLESGTQMLLKVSGSAQ